MPSNQQTQFAIDGTFTVDPSFKALAAAAGISAAKGLLSVKVKQVKVLVKKDYGVLLKSKSIQ